MFAIATRMIKTQIPPLLTFAKGPRGLRGRRRQVNRFLCEHERSVGLFLPTPCHKLSLSLSHAVPDLLLILIATPCAPVLKDPLSPEAQNRSRDRNPLIYKHLMHAFRGTFVLASVIDSSGTGRSLRGKKMQPWAGGVRFESVAHQICDIRGCAAFGYGSLGTGNPRLTIEPKLQTPQALQGCCSCSPSPYPLHSTSPTASCPPPPIPSCRPPPSLSPPPPSSSSAPPSPAPQPSRRPLLVTAEPSPGVRRRMARRAAPRRRGAFCEITRALRS